MGGQPWWCGPAVVALIVVGLAGCSAAPGAAPPATEAATATADAAATSLHLPDPSGCRPDAAQAGRPLRVWHTVEENQADLLRNEVQQRTGVTLDLRHFISVDDLISKLADAAEDQLPDLVLAPTEIFMQLATSGRVWPARPCLERLGVSSRPLLPIVERTWTVDGTLWAQPIEVSTLITYVNGPAVRSRQVPLPTVAHDLTTPSTANAVKGTPTWVVDEDVCRLVTEQWPAQRGRPVVGWDAATDSIVLHLDDPDLRRDLDELERAGEEGAIKTADPYALVQSAVSDAVPFVLGPSWGLLFGKMILEAPGPSPQAQGAKGVQTVPAPAATGRTGALVDGWAAFVPVTDHGVHPAIATVMTTMTSASFQAFLGAQTGFVPATPEAYPDPSLQAAWLAHPQLRVAYDVISATPDDEAFAGIKSPILSDIRLSLLRVCRAAINGRSYDGTLARAATDLQALSDTRRGAVGSR